MTVLLDDHLLRDWMVGPDRALRRAVGDHNPATTNLWYARLCKSAAGSTSGALISSWDPSARQAIIATLVALPEDFVLIPMRQLAWRMGLLVAENSGLSTVGSEAVAAAEALGASLLVSGRDESPGIRRTCTSMHITYRALPR